MNKLESQDRLNDIAIVGMAGRFPGAANIHEFWENLANGINSVSTFSREELLAAGVDPEVADHPDYVKAKALLKDADLFDAGFFGYLPAEAAVIDPQHRVFLETAWETLESAGYDPERYDGAIGAFAGTSRTTYFANNISGNETLYEQVGKYPIMIGNNKDFITTRVSYKLNLTGPSVNVQNACSTSLVAVSLACQTLLSYQCDMALAGGVQIIFPQKRGYLYREGAIYSPDGACKTFDARANGIVDGEGVGIVLLKRFDDAIADNDNILAVIKGAALNNDGSLKAGFTAPSVEGQSDAIRMALAMADVSADSIGYVETHGTGTPLGDPIEIAALSNAFRDTTDRRKYCAVGSVKTNIGHLDAAAGVTGLIKAVLALQHKKIPPTLNFETPNPNIDFDNSPFYVNTELQNWAPGEFPRRAGVSSLGLGGTNAHVILEEAPVAPTASEGKTDHAYHLLPLSAKSEGALQKTVENLTDHFNNDEAISLGDAAFTLQSGRRHFEHRQFIVAESIADAAQILSGSQPRNTGSAKVQDGAAQMIFMFPGGGAQYPNMGRDLYLSRPFFRKQVDECLAFIENEFSIDLKKWLFPSDENFSAATAELKRPSLAFLALFTIEYALGKLILRHGIKPDGMIGHSLGEYAAASLAGVFSWQDALRILLIRGQLMEKTERGAILSISLSEDRLMPMLNDNLSIATINLPDRCAVSGSTSAIEKLEAQLNDDGIEFTRVQVDVAAHSQLLDPILDEFKAHVEKHSLSEPQIPFISNLSGDWITPEQAVDPSYWVNHLRQTVRFHDGLQKIFETKNQLLLEVGPCQVLSTFARQHPARPSHSLVISAMRHPKETVSDDAALLSAFGKIWLTGQDLNWREFHQQVNPRRVPLPTYPFERKRYWIDPPSATTKTAETSAGNSNAASNSAAGPHVEMNLEHPMPVANKDISLKSKTRADIISENLKEILNRLSGLAMEEMPDNTTFLEMGFDSLFLTRANAEFKKAFDVKITFRQLFDEAPTINALAGYIDAQLPPEALQEELAALNSPEKSESLNGKVPLHPEAVIANFPDLPSGSTLEQVIARQLEIMSQQLAMLKTTPAAETTAALPARLPAAQQKGHGPWKPLSSNKKDTLTKEQQQHLEEIIRRYTTKTAGSKALTQQQRPHLADPRAISGFKPLWKEMIYQIAMARSAGSRMWDVDGNEYIDLTMGFGIDLLGHSPDFIIQAIESQLKNGLELSALAPQAADVAALICELTGFERVTFANTGSEANLAAIRAARTVTGRERIAVFNGDYHGIFDEVLVQGISGPDGMATVPVAPGIPAFTADNVLVLDYDDPNCLEVLKRDGKNLAAVVVEPVQSRNPKRQPLEILKQVREITSETGTALIFDEVITGFRLAPGGAQEFYGIQADIAAYGKTLSGGITLAAIAGKAEFMDVFDGGMWQYGDDSFPETGMTLFGGTFVRHPLALAASHAALSHIKAKGPQLQRELNRKADELAAEINKIFQAESVPVRLDNCGSMMLFSFQDDNELAKLFHFYLRMKGIYLLDNPIFLSTAHSDSDLESIKNAVKETLVEMKNAAFFPAADIENSNTQPVLETNGALESSANDFSLLKIAPKANKPSRKIALTEGQTEIWLAAQMSEAASCGFNICLQFDLEGEMNTSAMQASLQMLVDRHEALRTTFSKDGKYQIIAAEKSISVPVVHLINASALDDEVAALQHEEVHTAFDLLNGPLFRAKIVILPDQHNLILLSVHHIICDGWGSTILTKELGIIYSAAVANRRPALPEVMQSGDYAEWQHTHRKSQSFADDEAFWLAKFADKIPAMELPADRQRPPIKTVNAGRLDTEIAAETIASIKAIGAKKNCTLFATLLAAYKVFLYRLSGQNDLVVGIPTAGQSVVGEDVVSHCVNMLPVRSKLDGAQSFAAFLEQMQGTIMDTFEHQNFTFGSLVKKLNLPRDPARLPLISVTFNLDPAGEAPEFDGLKLTKAAALPRAYENFDIFMNLEETDNGITAECIYNSDLFDKATIQRRLSEFILLLNSIAANPEQSIDTLNILPIYERDLLFRDYNQTHVAFPETRTVHQLFQRQVENKPAKIAAIFEDQSITYRDLNIRANQIARYLMRNGVSGQSIVGIYVERSLDMLAGLLGIMKTGAAYVPLDPSFPEERLKFMIKDAGIQMLLTQQTVLERQPLSLDLETICLDAEWGIIAQEATGNPDDRCDASNIVYIIYTSGSTGNPKGVQIPHRAAVNFLQSMKQQPGISENDVLLSVTTLSFDIAVLELYLPIISGATTVIASRETAMDGAKLAKTLGDHEITIMQATPATWRMLMESGWQNRNQLKALCGGEAMAIELRDQLLAQKVSLWNMYGPTETTVWSTIAEIQQAQEIITIGKPIANTQIYILDKQMQPVPAGVPGELYIGGDGLAAGYLNRPELTAEKFIDVGNLAADVFPRADRYRIYRTGDLARWRNDGTLECLGRTDFQVKIRGYRIELGEIETRLNKHPDIRQSVVVARKDTSGAQQLIAYCIPTDGEQLDVRGFRNFLRENLPDYMIPARFIHIEEFPLTPNNKVDRKALPGPAQESAIASDKTFAAPRDKVESNLQDIWEAALALKPVGIHDNFFEIGGHSLLAAKLFATIEKVFQVKLPLAVLFRASTIADLADVIREKSTTAQWSSLVPIQPQGKKAPLFLVHGAEANVLLYRDLARHIGPEQPVYGLQARGLDGIATPFTTFEEMAAHYIKEIKSVQPQGPYYLGGYCLGGAIALEIAQQLQAQGEEIALLAMLETYNMAALRKELSVFDRSRMLMENIRFHSENILMLQKAGRRKFLKEKGAVAKDRLKKRASRSLSKLTGKKSQQATADTHLVLAEINDTANASYVPTPYHGKITLFKPQENFALMDDPFFGWKEIALEGVDVQEFAFKPKGMLVEPFVMQLAARLRMCIAGEYKTTMNDQGSFQVEYNAAI